jgi:hypothetical protein
MWSMENIKIRMNTNSGNGNSAAKNEASAPLSNEKWG